MRTSKDIVRIADGIYAEAVNNINKLAEVRQGVVTSIAGKPAEEVIGTVTDLIDGIETGVKAPNVDGVKLPAYLSKVTYEADGSSEVTITVRTKLKSAYKYRKDAVVALDEDFITNAGKVYIDALFDMFHINEAMENIEALNAKVAGIIAENEIPYSFSFVVDANSSAIVLSVNDNEVVFNASITRAQDIASLAIFRDGSEYNNLIRQEATDNLVAALKSIQTPVQLIKGNVALIKEVTGVSTKKRASKLIRDSYHRQAKFLGKVKTGVGYFDETVKINGEDVEVFALVSKAEDGTIALVLSPFDVKTLYKVDYDVVEAVKAQLTE